MVVTLLSLFGRLQSICSDGTSSDHFVGVKGRSFAQSPGRMHANSHAAANGYRLHCSFLGKLRVGEMYRVSCCSNSFGSLFGRVTVVTSGSSQSTFDSREGLLCSACLTCLSLSASLICRPLCSPALCVFVLWA